jgi:hypothetical protein
MAKTPPQSSSRKRKRAQDDAVAAAPLRRSRRVVFRDSFRFNDLPQELRDVIYGMALVDDGEGGLELTDKLPETAKALSQVSRAVRAESMGIYYSENAFQGTFRCQWMRQRPPVGRVYPVRSVLRQFVVAEVDGIEEWNNLFGGLGAPHLRALKLALRIRISDSRRSVRVGFINQSQPWTWTLPGQAVRYVGGAAEMEALASAAIRPQGTDVRPAGALRRFLTKMRVSLERKILGMAVSPYSAYN